MTLNITQNMSQDINKGEYYNDKDKLFRLGIKAYKKQNIIMNNRNQNLKKIVLNKLFFNYLLSYIFERGLEHEFNRKYYEVNIEEQIERNRKILAELNRYLD